MAHYLHNKKLLKIAGSIWFSLYLLLFLPTSQLQAARHSRNTPHTSSPSPTIAVTIGFNHGSIYRSNSWTPVHILLHNPNKEDFQGILSASIANNPQDTSTNSHPSRQLEEPVSLHKNTTQSVTLNVPFYAADTTTQGITVTLSDEHGRVIATQSTTGEYAMRAGDLLIGILSDHNVNVDALNNLSLPNLDALSTVQLNASSLPDKSSVLDNFDAIVLVDFTSKELSPTQTAALETWVNRGGILIEAGGTQWQRTLSTLPESLQPVTIHGTIPLLKGTSLVSSTSPLIQSQDQQALASPLPETTIASIATPRVSDTFTNSTTDLATGTTPLIVQAHQGQGVLCYVAFDLTSSPATQWAGIAPFWQTVLLYSFGNRLLISGMADSYASGPGQILTHAGILDMLKPEMVPAPFILLIFLFSYAFMLGPLRLYAMRRFTLPRWWNWRIMLGSIIIFSLLASDFALYQRGTSIEDTSISLLQIDQGSPYGHAITYTALLVPTQGNFTFHTSGNTLIQPVTSQFIVNDHPIQTQDADTISTPGTTTSSLTLQDLSPWTLHYISREQDIHLDGSIKAHLTLNNGRIIGTLTNTLTTTLHDAYILLTHSFVSLGSLAAGETKTLNLPIYHAPEYSGQTLADQIAQHAGLPPEYFPYSNAIIPQAEEQRHIALLSALNGEGTTFTPCEGPCKTHAITHRGTIFITGGRVPNPEKSDYEPLLLLPAQATLIGWSNHALQDQDNETINDQHPIGHQENFVQVPLTLHGAEPVNTQLSDIKGQIVNIQSIDAELTLPGVYTMESGSMTFQLTLPTTRLKRTEQITLTIPDLWANPAIEGPTTASTMSHLQPLLYNWHSHQWDAIRLQHGTFTLPNNGPYINAAQQLFLQVTNQDTTLGKLYFGTPSLHLQYHNHP